MRMARQIVNQEKEQTMADNITRLRELAKHRREQAEQCQSAADILETYALGNDFIIKPEACLKQILLPVVVGSTIREILHKWALDITREYGCQ